jgi:glycosyltransferase involved in cell wall biosynthesis/SAM-dependent methyltransferase
MIVKNEARVIQRCLDSVRPFIHYWVIVDTGSTDGTQELVKELLSGIPGELHERRWRNFGHNRTEALELARGKADYILIMDADEVFEVPEGFRMPALEDEQYLLLHRHRSSGQTTWELGTLVKASLPWRYEGVLHEHIACDVPHKRTSLSGPVVWGYFDSARNVDPQNKYANDARILEEALRDEPENARYVFYLGQSYRDSNQTEKAIDAYARRAKMGGWEEEVYYSLLQVAMLQARSKREPTTIVSAFLNAYQYRPTRAEALVELAAHYRGTHEWALAELFARAAVAIPKPKDILFVDTSVYDWRVFDELAIATYYTRKYEESAELNRRLLAEGKLPLNHRPRVQQNLDFSLSKIGRTPSPPVDAQPQRGSAHPSVTELEGSRIPFERCPLCASESFAEERVGDVSHHSVYKSELPPRVRWMRCANCGHSFTEGYFSPRALEVLFGGTNDLQKPGIDPHGGRRMAAKMVEAVRDVLGGVRGRWLDVGFGNGALLGTAQEYGFSVTGLDLRTVNVEWMNAGGIEAHAVDFLEYRPHTEPTVISFADVLEHVPFPKDVLRHAHATLADDGVLFVSMPNEEAFVWKSLDRNGTNPYWNEIEHYHNFGRKRLEAVLEDCGFTAVSYGISERYYMCMEVIAKKRRVGA